MHFAFTEEQQALAEMLRELLAARCSADDVRAAAGGEVPGLRAALEELGLLAMLQPEDEGGLGLGMVEACIALKELGHAGAPGGWIEALTGDLDAGGTAKTPETRQSRHMLGAAAVLAGLAERMLAMAVQHVQVREQFGRPVGSFQAVQHRLADAKLAIEFALPLLWWAAWSLDEGEEDADVAVWMAKHHCTEAALKTARKALQCHGAMGYAFEHDLQLFMKQAWRLAPKYGVPAACRRAIGDAMNI